MKWYRRLFRYPELWALSLGALLTRFWQLSTPNDVVFDEVYFREFAANYISGEYFFDVHPPLVKLFFAGLGSLFGFSPDEMISGDGATFALRFLPALAGVLLVPLMYVIIRQFGLGRRIAVLGAALVLLDGALLVESRFVLMDSLLLLFGMSMISVFLVFRKSTGRAQWGWLVFLGLLAGMVVSTKWSGLAMVAIVGFAWLIDSIRRKVNWQKILVEFEVVLVAICVVYVMSFMMHFAFLTKSGEGDAFMSLRFQSTLQGNKNYDKNAEMPMYEKIFEVNAEMYRSQRQLENSSHSYSSRWYTWPLMLRPVFYWQGSLNEDDTRGYIYLLGNPAVWWGSSVLVAVGVVLFLYSHKFLGHRRWGLLGFLIAGYFVNWLPFALINRPMFLYHYFFAFLFSILIACVVLSVLFDWLAKRKRIGKKLSDGVYVGVLGVVLVVFLYFLPIVYGLPLTLTQRLEYMWLPGWL